MANKDYYQTLGISKSASVDEVKKAYKTLARKHHPDVAKDKKEAEAKFKEINEAYQVLSNPQKKAQYDQFGPTGAGGGAGFDPFGQGGQRGYSYSSQGFGEDFDLSDIFENFFGGGYPQKGRDEQYKITTDFMDAIKGTSKETVIKGKKVRINIPAGANNGTKIKFEGMGAPARQKGLPNGDLYIIVEIAPHHKFIRRGEHIITEEKVPLVTAVLGGIIDVETVQGKVKLKIPEGTQDNSDFKIKGKGVKKLGGWGEGDHYVKVKVQIPTKLNSKAKRLFEELGNVI
jgi:DnaJ-class molecular chaperone